MKTELYRKVFIKSEEDLPKKEGLYLVHFEKFDIDSPAGSVWSNYNEHKRLRWLSQVDWYLQPVSLLNDEIEFPIPDIDYLGDVLKRALEGAEGEDGVMVKFDNNTDNINFILDVVSRFKKVLKQDYEKRQDHNRTAGITG